MRTQSVPVSTEEEQRPIVSKDVFRLLVKLETLQSSYVDTIDLAQKLHVPIDYTNEDTAEQRGHLVDNVNPGPGTYNVIDPWEPHPSSHPSAVFASKALRKPFQLQSLRSKSCLSLGKNKKKYKPCPLDYSKSQTYLEPPPPLGLFTRTNRGLAQITPTKASQSINSSETRVMGNRTQSANGATFSKAQRGTLLVQDSCLGPGEYNVKRLWEPSETTGIVTPDTPTCAIFSASSEKRTVVWSPARTLPSYAIPEAWNTSEHYAARKHQVLLELQRCKHQLDRQKSVAPISVNSQPALGATYSNNRAKTAALQTKKELVSDPLANLDPFDWLRSMPQGEQRVHAIATKHGLLNLVHIDSHIQTINDGTDSHNDFHQIPELHDVFLAHHQDQPNRQDNDDEVLLQQHSKELIMQQDAAYANKNQPDVRIKISCRLPGGLVVTVTLFSRKPLRVLKSAITRKQQRFPNENQFDLYLPNGRKLIHLEDALSAPSNAIHDRSLVQVVPTTTISK